MHVHVCVRMPACLQVRQLEGQVSSMQAIVTYSKQELALRARDAAELTQVKQELLTKEQKVREMKQVVSRGGRLGEEHACGMIPC